jgi:hypothetical protein
MIEDLVKPRELTDRQREHHRHAAVLQQPHQDDHDQDESDREYVDEAEDQQDENQREEDEIEDRRQHHDDRRSAYSMFIILPLKTYHIQQSILIHFLIILVH